MDVKNLANHFDRKAIQYAKHYETTKPKNLFDYEKQERLKTMLLWVSEHAKLNTEESISLIFNLVSTNKELNDSIYCQIKSLLSSPSKLIIYPPNT